MTEKLKGKKVLVTGGAGFIGSHITERLLELGAYVVVVDNLASGKKENLKDILSSIEFIEKDFSSDDFLGWLPKDIEYIWHQAALRSVPKSVEAPFDYHRVNVTGTLKLFLRAKELGVKRVVFASSSSVYGERNNFPEKEDDPCLPVSPYAASKLMGEVYGRLFTGLYGLPVVSLRYFNVFGPRQSLDDEYAVVVPKFINCLLEKKSPPIYGNGLQERDFTYIENVVRANILAMVKEGIEGEVFNVASGSPNSVNKLFEVLKSIIKAEVSPVYSPKRPGDVFKTEADITKTRELLGWKPEVSFAEGLEKTVAWFNKGEKI